MLGSWRGCILRAGVLLALIPTRVRRNRIKSTFVYLVNRVCVEHADADHRSIFGVLMLKVLSCWRQ